MTLAASSIETWAQRPSRPKSPTPQASKKAFSALQFTDLTRPSGINFHLTCGTPDKRWIMDSLCGGVAFFDYDNDGWMDLFLVNGSTQPDVKAGKCNASKLYRNNHDGTFIDVTSNAGLQHCRWGFGVAVGDYDNDGREDLYITDLDGGVLYHNNRNGTFTDVTAKAGVDNAGLWGTSAAFGDYDNDGFLDLYIANYVSDLDHLPTFGSTANCQYRGIAVSCGPRGLKGSRDKLYHNNGNGTFTDVTEKLGIDPDSYYGLGVLWLDYDKDGCLDLYVANDSSPSLLYHNNCRGGFTEEGVAAGVAFSADGKPQAGMGIDSADYDRDGWPDIVKTNFSDDTNNLFHNDRNGQFTDMAGPAAFGPVSIPFLGFGVRFFDFDNDGWPDIYIANGHVNPQVEGHGFGVSYAQRPLLFHNVIGRYEEVGFQSSAALKAPRVGRGLATADLMNDGTVWIVQTNLDGSPVLLRQSPVPGNWMRIKLVGNRSNRDGFGARVHVTAGGHTQMSEVRANSGYLSAGDPRLHIGIEARNGVDSIIVSWPSGTVDKIGPEKSGQELTIEEGRGIVLRYVPKPKHPAKPRLAKQRAR
jgi:hypothetical protein